MIESLKKMPSREDVLHEQIADTYFYQKITKGKTKHASRKARMVLIVSSFFVIVSLFIAASSLLHNRHVQFLKEKATNSREIKIFDAGNVNSQIIKGIEFHGLAKAKSRISRDSIVLNNPKKYNWADLSFDFRNPIDLSKRSLSLRLRGKIGGERLNLILRDANNRSYRLSDIYLTSSWSTKTISFDGLKADIDLSKITHLRFECGYVGESDAKMNSPIDFTIYITDILISKEA